MLLEFLDGSQIEVLSIFGGQRLINGVMRDTLRIEVSPDTISFDNLKANFKNNPKTAMLYTIEGTSDKHEIGVGYSIFVSIVDEERKVAAPPGKMVPDKFVEAYIVTISQMTYQEYQAIPPTKKE